MAEPTVSTAFVRSALRGLDPGLRRQVLADAGLAEPALQQAQARVPAQAFARLWMAVAAVLDDEFFALDSRRMKVGTFAMLCHAMAGQPTLGQALRLGVRGFNLAFDDLQAQLQAGSAPATAALVLHSRVADRHAADGPDAAADAARFADETLLVMLHGLLCWLAGRRVLPLRLDWAHPAPAHAAEHRRMFGPVQHYGAPATALQFDARVLDAPLAVTPAALKAFLRDAPQSVFLKQVAGEGTGARVRRQLQGALARGEPAPTLPSLARTLGLSPATLRRRLAAEGRGWQAHKDALRREQAQRLLADGQLTVAEVALRLGFDDASTFYRAFRKWTGQAPGAWRAAALADADTAATAGADR